MLADGLLDHTQASGVACVGRGGVNSAAVLAAHRRPTDERLERSFVAEDKAVEHTLPQYSPHVVSEAHKQILARTMADKDVSKPAGCFENRDGACRIIRKAGLHPRSAAFYECTGCSLSRIRDPLPRQRFRKTVVERTHRRLNRDVSVRLVTIGCGGLLTDFECLLGLWDRGVRIETIVAIDTAYRGLEDGSKHDDYAGALGAMAAFFAPARVFSFAESAAYLDAARRRPSVYGQASLFIWCDAGAVPTEVFLEVARTALVPGACAYELSNMGVGHGSTRPPLEAHLPLHLRIPDDGRGATSSMAVYELASSSLGGAPELRECDADDLAIPEALNRKNRLRAEEALRWLEANSRERAAAHGKRLFTVVFTAKPRMAVRDAPSRDAKLVGARATGEEVIADCVTADGWVRLDAELDTFAAYKRPHDGGVEAVPAEMWMLTEAADVGELLREVVLDGNGEAIDDDAWLPELV